MGRRGIGGELGSKVRKYYATLPLMMIMMMMIIISLALPACRRLLFPLFPRAAKEIGDLYTHATLAKATVYSSIRATNKSKQLKACFCITLVFVTYYVFYL